MKIVILDAYTSNPGDMSWDALSQLGELSVYDRTKAEEVVERCKEAEIVLTNKVILNAQNMPLLPQLKYIGVMATGTNVVDIQYAHEHGITVTNVPAYSTDSVAQMVFAHILNVTNDVAHYANENRNGRWSNSQDFSYMDAPLVELAGKTMGIVGLGNIGMRVAHIANAFGLKVISSTSKEQGDLPEFIRKVTMEDLFALSDILSLHCPLTDTTKEMINAESLRSIKKGAILVNTGRGPLINEHDVAAALASGLLRAYCADVTTVEPVPATSPLLPQTHAYLTPHIAWASVEARKRLINVVTNNVKAFQSGTPENVV